MEKIKVASRRIKRVWQMWALSTESQYRYPLNHGIIQAHQTRAT